MLIVSLPMSNLLDIYTEETKLLDYNQLKEFIAGTLEDKPDIFEAYLPKITDARLGFHEDHFMQLCDLHDTVLNDLDDLADRLVGVTISSISSRQTTTKWLDDILLLRLNADSNLR